MKFPSPLTLLYLAFSTTTMQTVVAHEDHQVEWISLATKLPVKNSDMSATYLPTYDKSSLKSDVIVLAGGCTSGNKNFGSGYYCETFSKEAYAFYPSTENIEKLPDMPVARYRHAAAVIDGKIYLVGGRNQDESDPMNSDALVKQIDVYDPVEKKWSVLMNLDDSYALSDNAAVAYDGKLYVMGGYNQDYEVTFDKLFSIDVASKEIEDHAPMLEKRGDAHAVYFELDNGDPVAFIMGGFQGDDNFCKPLVSAEKYDFKKDEWTKIDDLKSGRGDKAVAVMNNHVYAIGGETKPELATCTGENDVAIHKQPVALDDVESYNPNEADAEWKVETDFSALRFRAAAAAFPGSNTIYVFGGQAGYSDECDCFDSIDSIYAFRDESNSGGSIVSTNVLALVGSMVAFNLLFG